MSKSNEIAKLFTSFEDCKFKHDVAEAWGARDLMVLLGYDRWENFREAVKRAWDSCKAAKIDPDVNFLVLDGTRSWRPDEVFRGATKNPQGGRPSEDVMLTRRAAYLATLDANQIRLTRA